MKYIAGIIGAVLIVAGGYFLFVYSNSSGSGAKLQDTAGVITLTADEPVAPGFAAPTDSVPNDGTPVTGPLAPARTPPAGYKEYRNIHYRFALFYPDSLTVKEYDEGNNARTISFENADASQGFEIFVVPYGARQVSSARFKMDEPSGVMQEPTDVIIGGVRATMFFGSNGVMGDTREVWFIHGGYLYEVVSYKALDTWLGNIMQTWKFI